ncbi:MAG: hypothetical protein JW957_08765 [Candidatus Omnitrophica bacterium]|nr:hypothetical protein [Candidatus Omnitrophota bacterium]
MGNAKIGFMGLTLELYKEKLPALTGHLGEFSRELNTVLSEMSETVHLPVAWNKKTISEGFSIFKKEKVDGIVLVFLSYSASLEILPSVRQAKVPVLIWNTQKIAEIKKGFGLQELLENHGMHGVQDLASVLQRENISFSLITGHYKDKTTLSAVKDWCVAAGAASKISRARIGRIGRLFPRMGDFAMEPEILKKILGPETVEIGNGALKEFRHFSSRRHGLPETNLPPEVSWAPEISRKIKKEAVDSIAFLKKIAAEKHLSALAVNFEGMGKEMPMPFAGISCLMGEGFGYGGEGDIYSASAVLLGQILSGNKATFTEMFTTDYKNSRIFMSHMGESSMALRRKGEPVKLILNKMELGNGIPTAVPVFGIMPGLYTLFNLTGVPVGLKFIASVVTVINGKPLERIKTPHFFIKPQNKVEEFLTAYSEQGGTHHPAMAYGDIRSKLNFFCGIKRIPLAEI